MSVECIRCGERPASSRDWLYCEPCWEAMMRERAGLAAMSVAVANEFVQNAEPADVSASAGLDWKTIGSGSGARNRNIAVPVFAQASRTVKGDL